MSSGAVTNRRIALYGIAPDEPFAESVLSVSRISVRARGAQPSCGTRCA